MATYAMDEHSNMIEHSPIRNQDIELPPGVPHDESTFYANDRYKTLWQHELYTNIPQPKNEGTSIMASDFLTLEWGRLVCWMESDDGSQFVFFPRLKQVIFQKFE